MKILESRRALSSRRNNRSSSRSSNGLRTTNKGNIALISKATSKSKSLLTEAKSSRVISSRESSIRSINKRADNFDQFFASFILGLVQANETSVNELVASSSDITAVVEDFADTVKLLGSSIEGEDISGINSGLGEVVDGLVGLVDGLRASEVGVESLSTEIDEIGGGSSGNSGVVDRDSSRDSCGDGSSGSSSGCGGGGRGIGVSGDHRGDGGSGSVISADFEGISKGVSGSSGRVDKVSSVFVDKVFGEFTTVGSRSGTGKASCASFAGCGEGSVDVES